MTQEEFYTRLDSYLDSSETCDLIPPLVSLAKSEGLSVLVPCKFVNGEISTVSHHYQERKYQLCAPKWKTPFFTDRGYAFYELKIGTLFAELIDNGYGGITFAKGEENGYGVDWSDLNIGEPGPNDPCPCGSGKKYKKCCGRG